jgi:hypothetical protein
VLDSLLRDPQSLADARVAAFKLGHTRFNWDVEKSVFLRQVAVSLAQAGSQFGQLKDDELIARSPA